jgi:hypothetical protein
MTGSPATDPDRAHVRTQRDAIQQRPSRSVALDPPDDPLRLLAHDEVAVVALQLVELDQGGRREDELEPRRALERPPVEVDVVEQGIRVWRRTYR